jgi:polysaccharide export outer membrane protein
MLFFAVGFILFPGWPVKAQDAGRGGGTAPSASALPTSPAPLSPTSLADIYLINPYDELDVYVYDVPELSHIYTVSPSGTVTVPLLSEPLTAAGLTPDQFARSMEEAFQKSGRLRRPEIAVSVKQSRYLSVTVDGAVRSPQVLTEMAPTRLVNILTQCGGIADDAGTNLTITRGALALKDLARQGEQASPISTIELKKVLDGHDAASNLMIWPGDRVSVGRPGVYYVLGEVRTPGGFPLKNGHDELTVLRALALAGDVTSVAKKNKAMILRSDPRAPNGRDEIKLDLSSILAGKSTDPVLQANDILFIPGSDSKKVLRTLTGVPASALGQAGATALIVH